jgi:hypothetical protein
MIGILKNKNLPESLLKKRKKFINLLHKLSSDDSLTFIENMIKNDKEKKRKSFFNTNNIESIKIPQNKEYYIKNDHNIINILSSILFTIEPLNQISFPKGNNDNLISFIN